MDALKENKALVGVALVLALLVGVSAYTNRDSDASSDDSAQSETASKDNDKDKKDATETDNKEESNKDSDKESEKSDDKNSDDEKTKDSEKSDDEAKKDDEKTNKDSSRSNKSYQYIAQPGDSYSVLARKAVQTFGIIEGVKLSGAEIIAAETKLTQDAGAMMLNENQSIDFDQSKVKSAIEWAQDLSESDKAAWATYVPFVEFDTRKNGE